MKIHQSDYEALQEEFDLYFAESGADREYDSDRDKMEFEFISNKLDWEEWEVIPDLSVTTSFEEFVYPSRRHKVVRIIRNCLTTYHNLTEEDLETLKNMHNYADASYSEKNNRLYVRTRVVDFKLTDAQFKTYELANKDK